MTLNRQFIGKLVEHVGQAHLTYVLGTAARWMSVDESGLAEIEEIRDEALTRGLYLTAWIAQAVLDHWGGAPRPPAAVIRREP